MQQTMVAEQEDVNLQQVKQSLAIRGMTVLSHFHVRQQQQLHMATEIHTDVDAGVLHFTKKTHAKGMPITWQTMYVKATNS
jgi:hypothetical protein